MALKKRQPPRLPPSVSEVNNMPNANERSIELENIIDRWAKQLHQQSVDIERIKCRQQRQDQLNDDVGVTLTNVENEQKHLRALAMAASEDIGDLAGHDESIQSIQSQVGILSAVLQKRFEIDEPRKEANYPAIGMAILLGGLGGLGVALVAGAGKIAGWW